LPLVQLHQSRLHQCYQQVLKTLRSLQQDRRRLQEAAVKLREHPLKAA
jgi:hypothetical protein